MSDNKKYFLPETMCIYTIKNNINEKVYVGVTKNLLHRWGRHVSYLRQGNHPNDRLQRDFNTYGEEAFVVEVLVDIEEIDLEEEDKWINHFTSLQKCYNYTRAEKIANKNYFKWHEHPETLERMRKKVSIAVKKYRFQQYTRDGEFIREWESVKEIVAENPGYKWQNIYSVCNGYKKTYMGFVWKKVLKI